MSQPDWNARYSTSEFAYGTEPNSFLKQHADLLLDPVLSIAEGEGRNAVFLASQGLRVHAVDNSSVGLAKYTASATGASKLAKVSTTSANSKVLLSSRSNGSFTRGWLGVSIKRSVLLRRLDLHLIMPRNVRNRVQRS